MGWEWQHPRSRVPNSEEYELSWKRLEIQMAEIAERGHFIEIPFEHFVKEPEPYLGQIYTAAGTTAGKKTSAEMRRQRVPRANIVDGIPLSIYKRCGWVPPEKGLSEAEEYEKRRQFVIEQGASNESLKTLTAMCQDYDRKLAQSKAIS